jgi:nucleolar protein 53
MLNCRVEAPILPHPRDVIEVPAIAAPHHGTSYNPPAAAHQELLLKAHEIEERRVREATKLAAVKEKMDQGWKAEAENSNEGVAAGMMVDSTTPETDDDDITGVGEVRPTNRRPERKTIQQRKKAAKLLAEVRRSLS